MKKDDLKKEILFIDQLLKKRFEEYPERGKWYDLLGKHLTKFSERLIKYIDFDSFEPHPNVEQVCNSFSKRPIFICGSMKSGTTLLSQLLDNHSDLFVLPGDSHFFHQYKRWDRNDFEGIVNYWIYRFINPSGKEPFWFLGPDFNSLAIFSKYLNYFINQTSYDIFVCVVMAVYSTLEEDEKKISKKKYWVEKTPGNELHVPFFTQKFPDAKFIHIIRDPLENLASLRKLTKLRKRNLSIYEDALDMKKQFNAGRKNLKKLGDNKYHIIKYGKLVSEPEKVLNTICQFLGIPFEKTLLEPTENGVPAMSNSMFKDSRVRGKIIDQSRSKRFKNFLNQSTIQDILALMEPEVTYFGYSWDKEVIGHSHDTRLSKVLRKTKVMSAISLKKGKRFINNL